MTFNNKKLLVPILTVLVIGMTVGTAYALTVTEDKGIGCGSKNWGVRDAVSLGETSTHASSFGKNTSCTDVSSYQGRYNTAVITTGLTGTPEDQDIAWTAIYQGTTPWGENADTDGGATYDNGAFPLASDQSTDYNLKTQWVWTQDASPNSSNKSVYANYLTNLWFVDEQGTYDYFLVIDFLYDQLEQNGTTGDWKQRTVTDVEGGLSGTQYYQIFCDKDSSGNTMYHYNVVLDNSSTTAGTWYENTANIESHIAAAFSSTYDILGSCTDSTPGSRSNFVIVDQESGIEIQSHAASGGTGTAKGAFSFSELWY